MLNYKTERNPIITFTSESEDGSDTTKTILFIGDPHFGKRFTVGVPKDRVGDREKNILSEFNRLLSCNVDYIIIVGDLFDKFVVSPTVVTTVFNSLSKVTDKPIYIIPGNHDLSKDSTKSSSFSLFSLLANSSLDNVHVINKTTLVHISSNLSVLLDAYDPFLKESVLPSGISNYITVNKRDNKDYKLITVGHWDSMDLTDNGWLPSKELLSISDLVITGHEHSYRKYVYPFDTTKTPVLFTGSLQPYSHAEDPDSTIYITIDKDEISDYNLSTDFKYKCLRIICDSYFVINEPVDCYSLTFKIINEEVEDQQENSVIDDIDNYSNNIKSWVDAEESLSEEFKLELKTILEEKPYL